MVPEEHHSPPLQSPRTRVGKRVTNRRGVLSGRLATMVLLEMRPGVGAAATTPLRTLDESPASCPPLGPPWNSRTKRQWEGRARGAATSIGHRARDLGVPACCTPLSRHHHEITVDDVPSSPSVTPCLHWHNAPRWDSGTVSNPCWRRTPTACHSSSRCALPRPKGAMTRPRRTTSKSSCSSR